MRATIVITTFLLTIGFGALIHSQAAGPMGEKPGKSLSTNPSSAPFRTVDGKLLKVDGEFYVLEDPAGKERRIHVNKETVLLNGPKRPGDTIRAEITQSGHAISIQ